MIDERKRFRRFVVILATVIIVGVFFVIGAVAEGTDDGAVIASVMILAAIALSAAFIARKRLKEMKDGIPSEDERSTALKMRVGYLSFFVSVFFLMALGWIFGVFIEDSTPGFLSAGEVMFVAAGGMCIIFIVIWAAMSRGKGMR